MLILTLNIFRKDDILQDLYRVKVVCYEKGAGGGGEGLCENQLISSSTQSQYLKTTPKSELILNKLRLASMGTDWIENELLGLFSRKL